MTGPDKSAPTFLLIRTCEHLVGTGTVHTVATCHAVPYPRRVRCLLGCGIYYHPTVLVIRHPEYHVTGIAIPKAVCYKSKEGQHVSLEATYGPGRVVGDKGL